jgi:hypothetical protein
MIESKLSREKHIKYINHVSSIVKKKIHALRKISSDLDQFELLNIAHGSIYSVLYYAAGTWLKKSFQDKFIRRLKVLSTNCIWEKETRKQHPGIA